MNRIVYILIFLLALWASFLCGRKSKEQAPQIVEILKTDTLIVETVRIVVDTQYVDKPVPYKVEVRDTLYLSEAPKEPLLLSVKRYTDNKTYDMQVSGIDVQLDWINTFTKTEYRDIVTTQNIYIKPKKWNLYAGVDITIMENTNAMNLCGGISYTKHRWMIDAQVGREILRGDNYIKVGGRYNIVRF